MGLRKRTPEAWQGEELVGGLYGVSPLYDNNDCPWPADLTIERCPVGSVTE
jgi:hypothetical protein